MNLDYRALLALAKAEAESAEQACYPEINLQSERFRIRRVMENYLARIQPLPVGEITSRSVMGNKNNDDGKTALVHPKS